VATICRLIVCLLIAILIFTFSGCGNGIESEEGVTDPQDPHPPIVDPTASPTVTPTPDGEDSTTDVMNKTLGDNFYQETTPNYEVEIVLAPSGIFIPEIELNPETLIENY